MEVHTGPMYDDKWVEQALQRQKKFETDTFTTRGIVNWKWATAPRRVDMTMSPCSMPVKHHHAITNIQIALWLKLQNGTVRNTFKKVFQVEKEFVK